MKQAVEIAAAVRSGKTSAMAVLEQCLAGLAAEGGRLVAVTRILADRARSEAAAVDARGLAAQDVLLDAVDAGP